MYDRNLLLRRGGGGGGLLAISKFCPGTALGLVRGAFDAGGCPGGAARPWTTRIRTHLPCKPLPELSWAPNLSRGSRLEHSHGQAWEQRRRKEQLLEVRTIQELPNNLGSDTAESTHVWFVEFR